MTAKILQFRDYQGLAESRLPPEEVGQIHWLDLTKFMQRFAWGEVGIADTMPSDVGFPFIAPDGDSA